MEELREVINVVDVEVNLDTTIGMQMKAIKDLALKMGDEVVLKFIDGEVARVKVDKVIYAKRHGRDNSIVEKLYIRGKDLFDWNLRKAQTIKVVKRNPRSNRVLTDGLTQFNESLNLHLLNEAKPKATLVDLDFSLITATPINEDSIKK